MFRDAEEVFRMRAAVLADPFPTVTLSTATIDAARLLVRDHVTRLIVVDAAQRPMTMLEGTRLLHNAVPTSGRDDSVRARMVEEPAASIFPRDVAEGTVNDVLPSPMPDLPVVGVDASLLEAAAAMAECGIPLVAVVSTNDALVGAITVDAVLDRLLSA
jgi:CBS domain-containing protein